MVILGSFWFLVMMLISQYFTCCGIPKFDVKTTSGPRNDISKFLHRDEILGPPEDFGGGKWIQKLSGV